MKNKENCFVECFTVNQKIRQKRQRLKFKIELK